MSTSQSRHPSWDQPHYYKRRPSIVQPFNLDAPKPCICGREPGADLHFPPTVRLYLARQEASHADHSSPR